MSEKKLKVIAQLKIQDIPAGNATVSGTLAPVLGQKKINAAKFCKEFNELTTDYKGKICNVKVKLYEDQSYKIIYTFKPASGMILDAINEVNEAEAKKKGTKFEKIKGSTAPGSSIVATVSKSVLRKVAEEKMKDTNTLSVDSTLNSLIGTALSMGILVTGE